jgi:hypothetical protein
MISQDYRTVERQWTRNRDLGKLRRRDRNRAAALHDRSLLCEHAIACERRRYRRSNCRAKYGLTSIEWLMRFMWRMFAGSVTQLFELCLVRMDAYGEES